ncbi:glycosyltransferase family 4 protein [Polaribacter butkevichii]|uniref:Glycosyl transferase family 1 domain-containing protein n=1 Tax=Polaribacter butkevichii TaxID=218490 RepID=A0A2P6CEJ0_9FLAO|nr:glycosyltransferase family 4 protein [Polaribacter butkevichii]PQJ73320.1 hypothetical protein BTO14_08620 [Polaribacter butkevichii]
MDLRNKNIVLIIKAPVLGGAERQAIGFAKFAKQELNCNVSFIATHSGEMSTEFKNFLNEIELDEVSYYGKFILKIDNQFSIKNLKDILKTVRYLIKMIYHVRKKKPYMLVPFLNPPSKLAVLIYKFTGAKYTFWHQLGLDFFTKDLLEKYAIRKTPLFIANAYNGLDLITNDYNVPPSKLFCLPQYISIDKQVLNKITLKNEFQIDQKDLVIGMISHYRKEKLHQLLLEVFNKLSTKYNNIHLVLLGDKKSGLETEFNFNLLKDQIKTLNVNSKVSLLSDVPVEKVLNMLDIAVLVSTLEGTPNVVLEYMLYGVPVVSTNHSGCEKLLKDKEMLITNNSIELYNKLEYLINNSAERERVGLNNKIKINEYSKENYFKKFTAIFNSLS